MCRTLEGSSTCSSSFHSKYKHITRKKPQMWFLFSLKNEVLPMHILKISWFYVRLKERCYSKPQLKVWFSLEKSSLFLRNWEETVMWTLGNITLMILLSRVLVLIVFCGCFLTVRNICLGSLLPFGFGLKQSWIWLKNTFFLFGLMGEQQGNCCLLISLHIFSVLYSSQF